MIAFLAFTLAAVLALNVVGFIIAFIRKSDKFTDFSYALSFVAIAIISLIYSDNINLPNLLLAGLVCLWAIRLGSYLVMRIRKWGRDNRFDEIRSDFVKFLGFWVFQAITAWAVMIAPQIYFYQNTSLELNAFNYIGAFIFVAALALEAIADMQLYRFTTNPANKGEFIQEGLWNYSRHPNYFGEICVWLGSWVYTLGELTTPLRALAFISPLFIFIMIRFVSGVPKLEAKADSRWGSQEAYATYKASTGLLVPRFFKR